MKYTIANTVGRSKSFDTAKELLAELDDRNNGWCEGEGSIVEKNDVEIFNTDDYVKAAIKINSDYEYDVASGNEYAKRQTISIKKILAYKHEV